MSQHLICLTIFLSWIGFSSRHNPPSMQACLVRITHNVYYGNVWEAWCMSCMLHTGKKVQKHISSSIIIQEKKGKWKQHSYALWIYILWHVICHTWKRKDNIVHLCSSCASALICMYTTFAHLYPALAKQNRKFLPYFLCFCLRF